MASLFKIELSRRVVGIAAGAAAALISVILWLVFATGASAVSPQRQQEESQRAHQLMHQQDAARRAAEQAQAQARAPAPGARR